MSVRDTVFDRNTALSRGGGVEMRHGRIELIGCEFTANVASGDGAGAYLFGTSLLTLERCVFVDNASSVDGGGAWLDSSTNITVIDSHFSGNDAARNGGGLYLDGPANVIGSVFETNEASDNGGALHARSALTVDDCVFTANEAGIDGGAVSISSNLRATVRGSDFIANQAFDGGAMASAFSSPSAGTATIINSRFLQNEALRDGGALWGFADLDAIEFSEILGCEFAGNTAIRGGAMSQTAALIANCTIADNHAGQIGGVDLLDGAEIRNSILWANTDEVTGPGSESAQLFVFTPQITNTTIQGLQLFAGGGNSGLDPLFRDPAGPDATPGTPDDDRRLIASSPAIDSGDNADVPVALTLDLDGFGRLAEFGSALGTPVVDRGAYEAQDCNANMTPDDIETAAGLVEDCNLNLVPDTCEFIDCNTNGVFDECEIASGAVPDCNANGIPDACELGSDEFLFIGERQSPLRALEPLAWDVPIDRRVTGATDVTLTFRAFGDLSSTSSTESLQLSINGVAQGLLFVSGADCQELTETVTIPADTFNGFIDETNGLVMIELLPGSSVNATQCAPGTYAELDIFFSAMPFTDCDENGALDQCEFRDNPALDADNDFVLDVCQAPPCLADIDGNGSASIDDINLFVDAFLAGETAADIDADGDTDIDDINAFVDAFIAGCP